MCQQTKTKHGKKKHFAKINGKKRKKHYSNKQHLKKQQTALNMQALYTALYTIALKYDDNHD